jgi:hypothetical protein
MVKKLQAMQKQTNTTNFFLMVITFLLGVIIWFMQQDRTAIYSSIGKLDQKFQSNTEEHVCLNKALDTIQYHLINRERTVDKTYRDEFLPLKQQVVDHEKRITNVEYKTGIK